MTTDNLTLSSTVIDPSTTRSLPALKATKTRYESSLQGSRGNARKELKQKIEAIQTRIDEIAPKAPEAADDAGESNVYRLPDGNRGPATLTRASHEWATRPADERFTSLPELHDAMQKSRDNSASSVISSKVLEFQPDPEDPRDGLLVGGDTGAVAAPTNWAFGQFSSLAGAPASYLSKLPAPLAADCLNYGLKYDRKTEDLGVLLTQEDDAIKVRAATGPNYGRIWNVDIAKALMDRFGDGVTGDWKVPGEFGKDVPITKANTTIFGSDRDMFVFLADEKNRLQVDNRRGGESGDMARGFFVWNSEVGSKTIGAAFFLFDFVCMNRIVWGVEGYTEHRIRHTVGAPDRWLDEITPVLIEYAESAASPIEAQIKAAQKHKLEKVDEFLANRFSGKQAKVFMAAHEREEGRPIENVWDAVTAITSVAREIPNTDRRVELERKGGALLDLVAA